MNKVVIIGCGNVGMSYAYALLNQKTSVNELVLIDINTKKIEGEVMDLNHCLPFGPSKINIKVGDYSDCRDANIICIAAGRNQLPGETRTDLIDKNKEVFKDIVDKVIKTGFDGIFLIATNPLDVMTYITWKYSNFDHRKVIGSGTSLDTARLRYMIGDKLSINPKNIHAYVVGEHGDSEFVPWSNATVGLQNVKNFLSEKELDEIMYDVKNAAYDIIDRKGSTCYGIGMCLVRITNAILNDENTIITVSSYDSSNNVYYGGPTIINRNGVRTKIKLNLTEEEQESLNKSINVIKSNIENV